MNSWPDGATQKMVGSGAYKSEADAESAIQKLSECNAYRIVCGASGHCGRASLQRYAKSIPMVDDSARRKPFSKHGRLASAACSV